MENKEQYEKLVCSLAAKAVIGKRDDYPFVIKPIPDSDEQGQLDPRVYRVQQQQAQAMASMERTIPDPSDMTKFVSTIRAMFGWVNEDITETKVDTTYKTIEGSNGPIPLRIYTPIQEGSLPVVVFFHGGGFIGGSVDVVENPCKALAEKAGAVVVSVDYRLAPEHAFPAGLTDCFETVQWVYKHAEEIQADPHKIAVSGDSAGGNLATVCALMDRDKGTNMIKYQALIYPTVNMADVEIEDFKWSLDQYDIRNHQEFIVPSVQGLGQMSEMILNMYLQNNAEPTNPYFSPLLAEDLRGMPETLIVVAEFDYLRLECEAYARKLTRAGVATKLIQYNGVDHAFIDKSGLYPQAEDCLHEIAKDIKRIFL